VVAANIEKKKHSAIAKRCMNKYIIQGVSTEPIRRQCSLLILDDKMPFQLPQDSVIDFQFGLYLMWNPYNFTSVHKHIADLGGVSNAILPVSVQSTPRPAYDHPNAYKTNLFQFVFFSKQTGNHVSYLQNLAKGGSEFTLPIIVPALQSEEIINKTGPHQLCFALPINFWMEYYKAISSKLKVPHISVCDLSPHLGHKFTASILGDHDYIAYIVDPGDSVEGIKDLLSNFVTTEKLEKYASEEFVWWKKPTEAVEVEIEPQSKKRKKIPSNTKQRSSKKTKVAQTTTKTEPETDVESVSSSHSQ